jgi:hypothetical protein
MRKTARDRTSAMMLSVLATPTVAALDMMHPIVYEVRQLARSEPMPSG